MRVMQQPAALIGIIIRRLLGLRSPLWLRYNALATPRLARRRALGITELSLRRRLIRQPLGPMGCQVPQPVAPAVHLGMRRWLSPVC